MAIVVLSNAKDPLFAGQEQVLRFAQDDSVLSTLRLRSTSHIDPGDTISAINLRLHTGLPA